MISTQEARRKGLIARRTLSVHERRRRSKALCRHIERSHAFRTAKTIACYRAVADEADLHHLCTLARRRNKQVLFPVVYGDHQMRLVTAPADRRWRKDRFGILTPHVSIRSIRYAPAADRKVDLVLAPLSAFDAHFSRVGMGGGFYDRWISRRSLKPKPLYVGVGFSVQKVSAIQIQPHDVRLDAIVTDTFQHARVRRCRL